MPGCIVCGVDDSTRASEPVLVARWLSRRLGSRLVLVNVARVPVAPGVRGAPYAFDDLREVALARAQELLERTSKATGLAGAELRAVLGEPVEQLSAVAKEEGADLLVVGTHGYGNVRSALFGSVSRSLGARGPCPVVVAAGGTAVRRLAPSPRPARRVRTTEARPTRSPTAVAQGAR